MRYFLRLSYQGTNYRGYQRQKNVISIQQTIEDLLEKIFHRKVFIHGCGRTDAGVHASEYFAHADLPDTIDFDLKERMNLALPHDIAIHNIIPIAENANAQKDAVWRTYEYYFHTEKTPSIALTSAYYQLDRFDINKFREGIKYLASVQDFRTLCKQPDIYKHTNCEIDSIEIVQISDNQYKFTIKANRFLRSMIRLMVARLLDLSSGKLAFDLFCSTIESRAHFEFPYDKKAHPQGLYLSNIEYNESINLKLKDV